MLMIAVWLKLHPAMAAILNEGPVFPMTERQRRIAMMSMLLEAVVLAFCVGGAVGAVITMQLQPGLKRAEVKVKAQPQRYIK
jgi:hypothetical protein